MRPSSGAKKILLFILTLLPVSTVIGQESSHQIVDFIDLPAELNMRQDASCLIEFQEQWILNVSKASILKKVKGHKVSCAFDSIDISFATESFCLREISYEFSFLDPHLEALGNKAFSGPGSMEKAARDLQNEFISLINGNTAIHSMYNPQEQLLSVYFHEEWILDAAKQEFRKHVKGITPVIWQLRQTTDGEPIHDADTGLPVYYKIKLERIDFRNP